ncbi:MAG TPA: hypothetical protein VKE74_30690, partial [Gemmataceae bacterium]|nr:hypothetical protein [Gemmataceae bacterium]
MKLSAPPPPPPEPEPEPNPGAASAELPVGVPPALGDSAVSRVGTDPAAAEQPSPGSMVQTLPDPSAKPQPEAQPATWPTWFPKADFTMAVLAVGLGFLLASFAARNSDLWLHLAAGKRLVAGQYVPGSDPFSYSAADRAWVNHSWLWDFGAYVLYGGHGVLLVFVKALAVAAAGALLIGMCRPGYSPWPWAALTGVAFLAAAPKLILGPIVGSVLLLAVTLFILFRVPSRPGSWRIPIAIGVTFWLWANIDAWFILGPLALALVLAGEWIQQNYLNRPESENPDAEPLGRLPDVPTLARALAVGVVACMLNPHHYRVWQLPFELVGSSVIRMDQTMNLGLNLAPTDGIYTDKEYLGRNLNGLAYLVLLVGGGAVIGFGVGRLRVSHLVLWVGFALLSLLSVFAIPFFAVVAVPLMAAQLNAISARVTLGKTSERRTRTILSASAGGRVLCLVGLLAACVCAWPGWLHPPGVEGRNPARRVAWVVEPDPALVRAATQLKTWRESGALPADARGFIAS